MCVRLVMYVGIQYARPRNVALHARAGDGLTNARR